MFKNHSRQFQRVHHQAFHQISVRRPNRPTAQPPCFRGHRFRFLSRCNWELSDGNQIFGICEKSGVIGKPDVGGPCDYHMWFTDLSGSTVCCEGALQYMDSCGRARQVMAGLATDRERIVDLRECLSPQETSETTVIQDHLSRTCGTILSVLWTSNSRVSRVKVIRAR
jgi:hypothetical protein